MRWSFQVLVQRWSRAREGAPRATPDRGTAGSTLVAADRFFPSSKTCSGCGAVRAKLSLSERVFACDRPGCELAIDRDLNAALNLACLAAVEARVQGHHEVQVATIEAETLNARGGHVSPASRSRLSPAKREGSHSHALGGGRPVRGTVGV